MSQKEALARARSLKAQFGTGESESLEPSAEGIAFWRLRHSLPVIMTVDWGISGVALGTALPTHVGASTPTYDSRIKQAGSISLEAAALVEQRQLVAAQQ